MAAVVVHDLARGSHPPGDQSVPDLEEECRPNDYRIHRHSIFLFYSVVLNNMSIVWKMANKLLQHGVEAAYLDRLVPATFSPFLTSCYDAFTISRDLFM